MGKTEILIIIILLLLININTGGDISSNTRSTTDINFRDVLYTNIDDVTAIAIDSTSVWYGTGSGGVVRYYPELEVRLVYSTVDGLPSNSINDIVVDEYRNYVWVVTDNGVGVYDKRSAEWSPLNALFESHDLGTYPELNTELTCIAVTPDDIWIGNSNNEIMKLEYQNFSLPLIYAQYTLSNTQEPNKVNDLEFEPDNEVLWIAAQDGAYTYEYTLSIIKPFGVEEGYDLESVNTIAIRGSMVWFGTDDGAMSYDQELKTFDVYSMEYGLISNQVLDMEIQPSSKYGNIIWFCTPSGATKHYAIGNSWFDYTTQDGLGSNYVNCANHDAKNKLIWFGTTKGLTAYDYEQDSWRTLVTGNGVGSNNIENIQFDHNGRPWVITDNGLGFYHDQLWKPFQLGQEKARVTAVGFNKDDVWVGSDLGVGRYFYPHAPNFITEHLETFTKSDGLPSNRVQDLQIDDSGKVWVGTDNGVAYYQNKQWSKLNLSELAGNNVTSIAIDNDLIWIGTYYSGIAVYDTAAQTYQIINLTNGLISNRVFEIVIDQTEEIVWVGTDRGVSRFYQPYGLWYNLTESMGLVDGNVTCIATPSEEDMVLFGTPEGLCLYRGYFGFNTLNIDEGVASNNIRCVATDSADPGIIWIGTDAGISRYNLQAKQWRTYSTATGLAANDIRVVTLDDTMIWVGAYGGVDLYDKIEDHWRTYTTEDGLANNFVYDIEIDPDGEFVWFGTDGGGAAVYNKNNGDWSQYTVEDGLVADDVIAIEIHPETSEIWFGTDDGASSFNRTSSKWTSYKPAKTGGGGLADDWVSDIKVDGSVVWFATNEGVSKFDQESEKWTTYTHEDGLGHDVAKCIEIVDGVIWVGTNGGASYFNQTTEQWFTLNQETSEGIPENRVNAIFNTQEFIWYGTGGGVSRFNKTDGSWQIFTTTDGLAHNYVNSIMQDDAKMWFATNGGVSVLNLHATTMFLPMQEIEDGYLPDLEISIDDIDFSNYEPEAGEKVTITINLRNIGAHEVITWIVIYEDDPYLNWSEGNVIGLARENFSALKTETVTIEWQPSEGDKQYSLYFILDPTDEVPELDKNNNRVIIVIHVSEPSPEEQPEVTSINFGIIAIIVVILIIIIFIVMRKPSRKK